MSTINPTIIQDVSQDPRTHPIGILDQNNNNNNNNNNNINSNQYISNRLQPSFINNNLPSQTSTQLHHEYIGDSLNQQILLPRPVTSLHKTSEAAFRTLANKLLFCLYSPILRPVQQESISLVLPILV